MTFVAEWDFVTAHPAAALGVAATAAVTAAAGTWAVMNLVFMNRIATLRDQRDTAEKALLRSEQHLEAARTELQGASNEHGASRLLNDKSLPTNKLSDEALRSRALELSVAVRQVQELQRADIPGFAPPHDATEEQREAHFVRRDREQDAKRAAVDRAYGVIRGEVMAVRDEMLGRVPPRIRLDRQERVDHLYEFQAGPFPYHAIADDLERLARNL